MAKGGRDGGRAADRERAGNSAGFGDFADTRECLPALRTRSLGRPVAAEEGHGGCDHRPLRRRRRAGISVSEGSRTVPGRVRGAGGQVRTGTPPREDAPDGVWALRRRRPEAAWGKKTGDL